MPWLQQYKYNSYLADFLKRKDIDSHTLYQIHYWFLGPIFADFGARNFYVLFHCPWLCRLKKLRLNFFNRAFFFPTAFLRLWELVASVDEILIQSVPPLQHSGKHSQWRGCDDDDGFNERHSRRQQLMQWSRVLYILLTGEFKNLISYLWEELLDICGHVVTTMMEIDFFASSQPFPARDPKLWMRRLNRRVPPSLRARCPLEDVAGGFLPDFQALHPIVLPAGAQVRQKGS